MSALRQIWCWLTYRLPTHPTPRHTDAALDRLRGYRPTHRRRPAAGLACDLNQTGRWPR